MTLTITPDTGSSYDLAGSNPIKVRRDGQVSHRIGPNLYEERYQIIGEGDSTTVKNETRKLVEFGEKAKAYRNLGELTNAIWLREQVSGEIYARQGLLYHPLPDGNPLQVHWLNQRGRSRLLQNGQVFYGELVLTRLGWESSEEQGSTRTNVSIYGGKWEIASVYWQGMNGGRISTITLDDPTNDVAHLWVGIRAKGVGFTSFNPFLELESATLGTDTTIVNLVGYSNNSAARCSFATTPTMATRVTVKLSHFTGSNHHHMFGEYLVLLGYNRSVANDVLRLKLSGDTVVASEAVIIPHAGTVRVMEAGYVRLPGQSLRGAYSDYGAGDIGFNIQAERIAGTGNLTFDFVILVPSRHLLKFKDANLNSATPLQKVRLYTHPDGQQTSIKTNTAGNAFLSFHEFEVRNFFLPADDAMLVLAADKTTAPAATTMDINLSWYPAFDNYQF